MHSRWLAGLPLIVVLTLPVAAGEKAAPPTVVVRVRSLDTLMDNFKLVASIVGKEEIGRQIEGLIKSKVGPKGLEGIDTTRPIGAYGRIGQGFNDLAGVVLVPISDEKTVLTLLENLGLNVRKGAQDIYTVSVKVIDVHFRFAHKYVYISALSTDALADGKLVPPEQIFPAGQTAMVSASVRIDQVPEIAKNLALSNVEEKLEETSKKLRGETEAQHAVRLEAQREFLHRIKAVLSHGRELALEVDLAPKTKELVANLTLTATPESELAKIIAGVGKAQSVFGGIKSDQAVVNGRVHVMLPTGVAKALEKAIKEDVGNGIAGIGDPAKRKQAEALIDALLNSFKSGDMDAMAQLNAVGKNFNLLAGIKLEDGNKLGSMVHDLAAELLKDAPPAEQAKVKLNAESAGDVKIHRIDVQKGFGPEAAVLFGDNPLYIAFRADAVLLAVGEGALDALKTALTASPGASPAVRVEIALARLAPLLAKTDEQRAAAGKLFGGESQGRVRLTVEGGDALRVRFASQLSVVQFFGAFAKGARFPSLK